MSKNWMRHFEIQLLDDSGNGIVLSDLKVTFDIEKMPATIFNGFVANFKIYNLSQETQNRIQIKNSDAFALSPDTMAIWTMRGIILIRISV